MAMVGIPFASNPKVFEGTDNPSCPFVSDTSPIAAIESNELNSFLAT